MPMHQTAIDAEAGAATNGGRGPTVVAAAASASPELSDRPRQETFTARDKRRTLAETDRAADTGGIGAILRREGLYCRTPEIPTPCSPLTRQVVFPSWST